MNLESKKLYDRCPKCFNTVELEKPTEQEDEQQQVCKTCGWSGWRSELVTITGRIQRS